MKETRIIGLRLANTVERAPQVQEILTKFGCCIRTRLGLHDTGEDQSDSSGLILLELSGDVSEYVKLENELLKIEGAEVQKMTFRAG